MRRIWTQTCWLLFLCFSSIVFAACNPLDKKNVGGLQVITHETPSSLFLDGQYLDKTPFIGKTIKPGTYTLRIEPDNTALIAHEAVVRVHKGLLTVVTWKPGDRPETSGGVIYEMEPIAGAATELSFVTIPDNAIIKVDQGEQQFSPLIVPDVEPGHHQFEVSLPSYETQKHTINVVKDHRITISVKLAKTGESVVETDSAPKPFDASASTTTATPSARSRSGTTGSTVTITATNFYQNGKEGLRVRSQPSPSGTELGFASVGSSHPYLNEQQSGWYKIQFNGSTGWVSGQYASLSQ